MVCVYLCVMQIHLKSEDCIGYVAKKVLNFSEKARVFAFYGEMGAGKTTLVKALCKELDVIDAPTSPSFSIVNEYHRQPEGKIYHFDFYRINNAQEVIDIGVEEYLCSGNYCFIEWPEKIHNLLPENFVRVRIEVQSDNSRNIILSQA